MKGKTPSVRTVILIGGYLFNANYGDVIQAKVWLDYYQKLGYRSVFIFDGENQQKKDFEFFMGNVETFTSAQLLNGAFPVPRHTHIHYYGGGYLNALWYEVFLNVLKYLHRQRVPAIFTGIQLDRIFVNAYRAQLFDDSLIHWVSVRDRRSRRLLQHENPFVGDDTLLYFAENERLKKPLDEGKERALIFVADKRFVVENTRRSALGNMKKLLLPKAQDQYEVMYTLTQEFIRTCKDLGIDPLWVQNFRTDPDNSRVMTLFGKKDSIGPFDLEKETDNCSFCITTSFHLSIMSKLKFNVPVYMFAMSDYYYDKALALIDYGVLTRSQIIRSWKQFDLKHLTRTRNIDNGTLWTFAQYVRNRTYREVDEILTLLHTTPSRAKMQ